MHEARAAFSATQRSQAWWYIPVLPAFGKGKQEELKFRVILSYKVSSKASLGYIDWSS